LASTSMLLLLLACLLRTRERGSQNPA
jgi:hypothetical protein